MIDKPIRPNPLDFENGCESQYYIQALKKYFKEMKKWKILKKRNDIEGRAVLDFIKSRKKQHVIENEQYKRFQSENKPCKKITDF